MARFKFRYQTLLEQRRRIEDECQRDLAQHLRERMILTNHLRQMQQTISTSKQSLSQSLVGQVDMNQIADFARYAGQTTQSATAVMRRLARKEQAISEARQRLDAAMRQRKAIELLRDKDHRQWQLETERRETAVADELALQAYTRQLAGKESA